MRAERQGEVIQSCALSPPLEHLEPLKTTRQDDRTGASDNARATASSGTPILNDGIAAGK